MNSEQQIKAERIAELNDQARKGRLEQSRIFCTPGVSELPSITQGEILEKVVKFEDFTPDNDPYGEHDFGSFDHDGEKYFWKIDYYNPDFSAGSEDPSDPGQTERVLTIMRADEY